MNFLTANCRSTTGWQWRDEEPTASSPSDGLLYFVVPPARFLVVMEPENLGCAEDLAECQETGRTG